MIDVIQQIFNQSKQNYKSKNFYFERHMCEVKQEEIKIDFNYTILCEKEDKKIFFGFCNHCKKIFYNEEVGVND